MTIYQKIASALLAGTLSLSTAGANLEQAKLDYSSLISHSQSAEPSMAREYNRWVDGLKMEGHIPRWLPVYFSDDMSSDAMAKTAKELYDSVRNGEKQHGAPKRSHLFMPYIVNGATYYIDRLNNNEVAFSMMRQPSGYYSWLIDDEQEVRWGGRGQMGTLLDKAEDGDLHRDLYRRN